MEEHFEIINQGSLALVKPLTEWSQNWWKDNVDDDAQMLGQYFVVEPRYLQNILEGFAADYEPDVGAHHKLQATSSKQQAPRKEHN